MQAFRKDRISNKEFPRSKVFIIRFLCSTRFPESIGNKKKCLLLDQKGHQRSAALLVPGSRSYALKSNPPKIKPMPYRAGRLQINPERIRDDVGRRHVVTVESRTTLSRHFKRVSPQLSSVIPDESSPVARRDSARSEALALSRRTVLTL